MRVLSTGVVEAEWINKKRQVFVTLVSYMLGVLMFFLLIKGCKIQPNKVRAQSPWKSMVLTSQAPMPEATNHISKQTWIKMLRLPSLR